MGWVASGTPAPSNQAVPDPCTSNPPGRKTPRSSSIVNLTSPGRTLNGYPPKQAFRSNLGNLETLNYTALREIPAKTITFPASTFILQSGSIEPIYPDYYGAFVYDLHIKKWGKVKHDYRRMFEMFPINTQGGNIISYDIFGSDTAIINAAGEIYLHDKYPTESLITWGKIGYFRKGMTDLEEVKLHLADLGIGILSVEGSLDGKNLSAFIATGKAFSEVNEITLFGDLSARWYNIKVEGVFDITGLEFRGVIKGKR